MAAGYSIRRKKVEFAEPAFPACRGRKPHHWLLDGPEDGKVVGKCKRCKATRVYSQRPADYPQTILNDPLPRRTYVGASSLYDG